MADLSFRITVGRSAGLQSSGFTLINGEDVLVVDEGDEGLSLVRTAFATIACTPTSILLGFLYGMVRSSILSCM